VTTATTYYNENDPFAAAWLRQLILAGLIAPGDVDERSIEDVKGCDLVGYKQCHFFAGIGGWSYALRLAGWPDDLEVWTGSCPCQPFSVAGKRAGEGDKRHLWPAFRRLISERRPSVCFGEQVAGADGRLWLSGVRLDLEGMGYRVGAADLCAASVGAPHIRQRLYWVADSDGQRQTGQRLLLRPDTTGWDSSEVSETSGRGATCGLGDTERGGLRKRGRTEADVPGESSHWSVFRTIRCLDGKVRRVPTEPAFFPLADGLSTNRVGILRGAGNAIVPPLAAEFIKAYQDVRGME
jgi:DNA (cytosine-5)-methyltransferase 1